MSYTTHTAKVGAAGTELFFADSGAVPNSDDYTTVVIWHGSAFPGPTFYPMIPHAAERNLRLVILNRREYAGSTRYTDDEIDDMKNGRKVFLERLGVQVADFLLWFLERNPIPKISADRKNGGFAVLGWSMGTATAMALFAHPEAIPQASYEKLGPYVKDLVLDEPPYLSYGYKLPADEKTYNPWTDPDCKSGAELYHNFSYWVSSYYEHPDTSGSIHGLDYRKRTSHASIENMTPEQVAVNFDEPAATRSELAMYIPPMQDTLNDQITRVLYDEKLLKTVFPNVKVTHISGTLTNWHCIWGYIEAKRDYDEHVARGAPVRPTKFILVEGGNHFLHWDMPKELLDAIVEGIHS